MGVRRGGFPIRVDASLYFAIALTVLLIIGLGQTFILVQLGLRLRRRLQTIERRVIDGTSWIYFDRVLKPKVPLPQVGGWLASTDFLIEVTRLIHARKPELVVELGSGLSTLVVGLTLKAIGRGRLVSIDHEDQYAEQSRTLVSQNELGDFVTIRLARLTPYAADQSQGIWYDVKALGDLTGVDMVIVDGPPAALGPSIRQPALTYFWDRLAPDGVMIFDDAARPGERAALLEAQSCLPGAEVEYVPLERGMAVVKKCAVTNP